MSDTNLSSFAHENISAKLKHPSFGHISLIRQHAVTSVDGSGPRWLLLRFPERASAPCPCLWAPMPRLTWRGKVDRLTTSVFVDAGSKIHASQKLPESKSAGTLYGQLGAYEIRLKSCALIWELSTKEFCGGGVVCVCIELAIRTIDIYIGQL